MSLPGNGIYVVRGEMATLMTAMRRGTRWNATAYVVTKASNDNPASKLIFSLVRTRRRTRC